MGQLMAKVRTDESSAQEAESVAKEREQRYQAERPDFEVVKQAADEAHRSLEAALSAKRRAEQDHASWDQAHATLQWWKNTTRISFLYAFIVVCVCVLRLLMRSFKE